MCLTRAYAKRTGATASAERKRREPVGTISELRTSAPVLFAHAQTFPFTCFVETANGAPVGAPDGHRWPQGPHKRRVQSQIYAVGMKRGTVAARLWREPQCDWLFKKSNKPSPAMSRAARAAAHSHAPSLQSSCPRIHQSQLRQSRPCQCRQSFDRWSHSLPQSPATAWLP